MSIRMSPNNREVLSAISSITGKQEYLTSTSGILWTTTTLGAGSASIGNVGSTSATGVAVPANAFYFADNLAGNLTGLVGTAGNNDSLATTNLLLTGSGTYFNNGTNWDRGRNNITSVVIAAGTITTQTGITLITYNASRATFLVNISAGAGTVTVAVNETSVSGYSTNILTSTALIGTGTTALRIFPGATAATNLVANDMIPRNISVTATVVGTITYGIDVNLGR